MIISFFRTWNNGDQIYLNRADEDDTSSNTNKSLIYNRIKGTPAISCDLDIHCIYPSNGTLYIEFLISSVDLYIYI